MRRPWDVSTDVARKAASPVAEIWSATCTSGDPMHASIPLIAAAIAAAGCSISTRYTPRTPGVAALAIQRGDLAVYKDGSMTPVSSDASGLFRCSPPAAATFSEVIEDHGDYRTNMTLASVMYGIGVFVMPVFAVGAFFGARAADAQQQARAGLVDAINRHNDRRSCRSVP